MPIKTHLPLALAMVIVAAPVAGAAVLAHDTFDYMDGTSIAEKTGGVGFITPWVASAELQGQTVQQGAVVFGDGEVNPLANPSQPKGILRTFSNYSGDVFYIKYTFSTGAGTLSDADRFYLVLSGRGDSNGWGTFELGTGLRNSAASNLPAAVPDDHMTVRTHSVSAGRRSISPGLADETPYTIVAEVRKTTSGNKEKYDHVRLWVNPSASDIDSPALADSIARNNTVHTINRAQFQLDETDPGDVYRIHEIMIATEWSDVIATTEDKSSASGSTP